MPRHYTNRYLDNLVSIVQNSNSWFQQCVNQTALDKATYSSTCTNEQMFPLVLTSQYCRNDLDKRSSRICVEKPHFYGQWAVIQDRFYCPCAVFMKGYEMQNKCSTMVVSAEYWIIQHNLNVICCYATAQTGHSEANYHDYTYTTCCL